MKRINIEELRNIQISLLSFVDKVCKENNLNYSLCGGSLLGAIRHKGYIPWDDDIDIFLPRPDYEKLINLLNVDNKQYKILNCFLQKDYFLPFSKLIDANTTLQESYERKFKNYGIFIDIFPIDGLPNDLTKRDAYWNKIKILKRLNTMVYSKTAQEKTFIKQIFRRMMFILLGFIPHNFIAKKLNRLALKNNYEPSEFVACSVFGYGVKEQMSNSCVSSFINVEFEQKQFSAITGWHTYLSNLYGDYMKLPPKEDQIAKHDFEAYGE